MCLIFIAQHAHPNYPLIIAANRDEFYQRPSTVANFWEDNTGILAGKDEKAGGTWLGINRHGRFAAITNYREQDNRNYNSSRGNIPSQFLSNNMSFERFSLQLQNDAEIYAGFNCLFGELSNNNDNLHYYRIVCLMVKIRYRL